MTKKTASARMIRVLAAALLVCFLTAIPAFAAGGDLKSELLESDNTLADYATESINNVLGPYALLPLDPMFNLAILSGVSLLNHGGMAVNTSIQSAIDSNVLFSNQVLCWIMLVICLLIGIGHLILKHVPGISAATESFISEAIDWLGIAVNMKKIVAMLLSVSMLLSLAGCESSSKGDGEGKLPTFGGETKATTTETEPTETEPTETEPTETEPTETETDPTTDTSATETSDTTPSKTDPTGDPKVMNVSHDLKVIPVQKYITYLQYGAIDPHEDTTYGTRMSYVSVYLENLDFMDAQLPDEIKDRIYSSFTYKTEEAQKNYAEQVKEFAKLEQSGAELFWDGIYARTKVYRSDEQIISFYQEVSSYHSGNAVNGNQTNPCNFRTSDGKELFQEDVVLDKDALIAYIQENCKGCPKFDETIAAIEEGSLFFTMLYDGIYIPQLGKKIPFIGNEGVLNGNYFGATPECYTLILDSDDSITWDIDGDGKNDRISVDVPSPNSMTVTYNDQTYGFTVKEFPEMDESFYKDKYYDHFLLFTDSGVYLIYSVSLEADDYEVIYVYKITDGKVLPAFSELCSINEFWDPNALLIGSYAGVLGFARESMYCSLTEEGFTPYSLFGDVYEGPYQTLCDLPGKEFDSESFAPGAEYTIPKDSKVSLLYYSDTTGDLIVKVLDPEEEKTKLVCLKVTDGWYIEGIACTSALIGMIMAG